MKALSDSTDDRRPVERWNPEHCGEIDIVIKSDGSWWHEGSRIARKGLVELFASVLRKDDDGITYLVTPVEKLSITVERAHFVALEFLLVDALGGKVVQPSLLLLLNSALQCVGFFGLVVAVFAVARCVGVVGVVDGTTVLVEADTTVERTLLRVQRVDRERDHVPIPRDVGVGDHAEADECFGMPQAHRVDVGSLALNESEAYVPHE